MGARRSQAGSDQRPPYPIRITDEGIQSIEQKHTHEGVLSADKSIFNVPEGRELEEFVRNLVGPAESVQPAYQPERDTYKRVVETDAEGPIGWDEFGNPVWDYTVLTTEPEHPDDPQDLFNAFPGR
jgi:hypothetical protein